MTNDVRPSDMTVDGAQLQVEDLQMEFEAEGKRVHAVNTVSITVRPGEFFTLLGPSGCGKTTTLRIIAGLERPTGGRVVIDDRIMSDTGHFVAPENRHLGMVFQQYAVWPHMTVFKNVAFPMRVARTKYTKAQMQQRVEEVLNIVQLTEQTHRPATLLSGGQQQRLALARALVSRPGLMLLDEPLSNLDARLRDRMRLELKHIQQATGVTAVYVTHDQAEALSMSDRVAVMNGGEVAQEGTPREIYEKPANPFVAKFVGSTTLVDAEVLELLDDQLILIRTPLGKLKATNEGHSLKAGDHTKVSIRPENITLHDTNHHDADGPVGTVREVVFQGDTVHCVVEVGDERLTVRSHPWNEIATDDAVRVNIPARACVVVVG